jgi:hypothetical protein
MKTYKQFIVEAKRIRIINRFHGTSQKAAKEIKSDGFKGGEGSLGFGVYSTPSKKEARYHAERQTPEGDKPEVIQLRTVKNKKRTHHIHARNMYDRLPSDRSDPLKRNISDRVKSRAQAQLAKDKDVVVSNFTDKSGKVIGREIIQTPERATQNIVKHPTSIVKSKSGAKRTKTQPKQINK